MHKICISILKIFLFKGTIKNSPFMEKTDTKGQTIGGNGNEEMEIFFMCADAVFTYGQLWG